MIFALQAQAKESIQKIDGPSMLQVTGGLRCTLEAGQSNANHQMKTEYKSPSQESIKVGGQVGEAMELTHIAAYQEGCEIEKLDQIVQDSFSHFGFKTVQLHLTKNLEESFINGFNECVARYKETLKINLGRGVELTSEASELKKMNDCQATSK